MSLSMGSIWPEIDLPASDTRTRQERRFQRSAARPGSCGKHIFDASSRNGAGQDGVDPYAESAQLA